MANQWKVSLEGWDGIHFDMAKRPPGADDGGNPEGAPSPDRSKLAFAGKFGAKFAQDGAAFWNVKNMDGFEDGWEVRRARIYMAGDVFLLFPWSFQIEVGKTGRTFTVEESYLTLRNFPRVGILQMGQFQAPMSLEGTMPSRDVTFMEESSAVMALAPGTNTGLKLGRPAFGDRMTWALGLFTSMPVTDEGDASKAGRAMFRLTWLARDELGADVPGLIHLGVSGSHLFTGADRVQYRSRPESHLAPYTVDTGDIEARGADTTGLEGAWVKGPVSIQAEVLQSWVNRNKPGGARFWGSYIAASWFVTGESRTYSRREGKFIRQEVSRPFSLKHGGSGALEMAVRYSVVDLNSGGVHGGKMRSVTAGLNWYVNPNLKLRLNAVAARSDLATPASRMSLAEIRIEFDF